MKTPFIVISAGFAAALVAAPAAQAATTAYQDNWYAGFSGDLTWLRHSDTGGGGNIDLGYLFPQGNYGDFRLEGEAGYHGASGKDGYNGTHYFTYMGNLYYDFNNMFSPSGSGWHVAPYIGGGLGDAAVHFGSSDNSNFTTTFRHHENEFAYQGMAGLTFTSASMPKTDWSVGYRYLGTDTRNIHSNSIELGVRFHF